MGSRNIESFAQFILQQQDRRIVPKPRISNRTRINLQIDAGHDDGAIVASGIGNRDAHAGRTVFSGFDELRRNAAGYEMLQQKTCKSVITDGTEQPRFTTRPRRRNSLIAAFATKFRIPKMAGSVSPLAGRCSASIIMS